MNVAGFSFFIYVVVGNFVAKSGKDKYFSARDTINSNILRFLFCIYTNKFRK